MFNKIKKFLIKHKVLKCTHSWVVINSEEVNMGLKPIRKCKKCNTYMV